MSVQNHRDLVVWQRAMDLVERVYIAPRSWPKEELYGLTNQIRRAAVSVPANIAEGQGRHNPREFLRFLAIANGSLLEVETHLAIAQRLGYFDEPTLNAVLQQSAEVGRLLHGLRRSLHSFTDTA